jgi:hypothetical protein
MVWVGEGATMEEREECLVLCTLHLFRAFFSQCGDRDVISVREPHSSQPSLSTQDRRDEKKGDEDEHTVS